MTTKQYNFIGRLINKITLNNESNNTMFCYYRHMIVLQSGTKDYVSVTVHHTTDPYSDILIHFSFDYWTYRLHFIPTGYKFLTEKVLNAFISIYGTTLIRATFDQVENGDE